MSREASTALAAIGRDLAARGLLRATSGNLSVRLPNGFLITASGRDKGALGTDDFLIANAAGAAQPGSPAPSAEAGLHAQLYSWDAEIGAVLHVHGHAAAVLGRLYEPVGRITITGWEMAKALRGVPSHQARVELPIFANDQDIQALAHRIAPHLRHDVPGYVLSGHGLYAWGRDLPEAMRHIDAFDYLLTAELALLSLRGTP